MTEQDINTICWWVPFRNIRTALRNVLKKIMSDDFLSYFNSDNHVHKYVGDIYVLFGEYFQKSDFLEKYIELISKLDSDSINNVNNVIRRINLMIENDYKPFKTFNEEEQTIIKNTINFKNSITKISDEVFAYKNYLLPINQFESSVFFDKHNISLIDSNFWMTKNIVDVGAYIGDSAIMFADILKQNTIKKDSIPNVYSFEPSKVNFSVLQKTLKINNIENVVGYNVLLGDCAKKINFFELEDPLSINSLKDTPGYYGTQSEIELDMVDFDTFVKENNINNIGLIKVDIEGAEQLFLKGARKTIEKYKPVLLLSIYHNGSDFFEIKPMLESWNLNYKFKVSKPALYTDNVLFETLLIAEPL